MVLCYVYVKCRAKRTAILIRQKARKRHFHPNDDITRDRVKSTSGKEIFCVCRVRHIVYIGSLFFDSL